MTTTIRFLAALAVSVLLAACDEQTVATTSAEAPELAAIDLGDRAVKLADYRDKVVLVTFWLNGCGPCLAEFPGVEAIYRRHKDQGLAVLAVNLGQDKTMIEATLRKVPVTFPFLADPLGITAKRYGVEGAPTTFLIDGKGIVRERLDGPLPLDDLERKIQALI
ncbi:TlpA disulfide reductase family protein [Telmatospirillum sp.]|uniref:TlpA family protein disulfide reductase n=1 Tax=Telmatospirillum sp. TaxID=2079197 RepID=UPI00285156C1|nr:TlpA disulfide reductase family protein [Telmatospirillum sp.]MDR3435638.1 TlpA disulfide reductase family protein [Telmatospirillum sp.]